MLLPLVSQSQSVLNRIEMSELINFYIFIQLASENFEESDKTEKKPAAHEVIEDIKNLVGIVEW